MRAGTARLTNGLQLHYVEQGDADGDAVVLLHGWPDSGFTFSRVLPFMPPRYRVLALDQRGFGESSRPGSGYRIDDFADDVAAFCDATSVRRATIVGHSFGTFVARRFAIAHPEYVQRLVLLGSGHSSANPVTREVQAAIRDLTDPVPIAFAREFQASTAYVPIPEAFFDQIIKESLKLPAPLWRAAFDGLLAYDDAAKLGGIAAPTLLIWGSRDGLFSRDDQDRLLAAIPHASLNVYADTGHCPNWERPERVAADIAAFMHESGPAPVET
jgi:pimeloyl-ACP methyl ester carboxylesterase